MTSTVSSVAPHDDAQRFSSLAELRVEHSALLKVRREAGETPEVLTAGMEFIRRGRATGAVLDADSDRGAAQSLLDYWSTLVYRAGSEPPDATLADFDPTLAPELDDARCPYVGLDAFREANQAVFFGRERLIEDWVARVRDNRFLAVVGSSGSGKSSLVLGGLLPNLKAGGIPGSNHWHFLPPFVPGPTPLAPLARLMHTSPDELRNNPDHWQELTYPDQAPFVLVVDQFEELFTVCDAEVDRQAFVNTILSVVRSPGPRHTIIVTMRSDFESQVARLPELQAVFERDSVRVTPLNAAELREAIARPAELAGLRFEEGIIDELVKQILGEPVGLPLLQYTLLKLWENRARNRVTWDAYRRLGGAREALARSADEVYNGLIPEDQVVAKRILLRLVRPGEGLDVTSNRVRRTMVYLAGEDPGAIDRVLDRLIGARLIRRTEGETAADEQIEVAHEALVRNWPRLVDWLEEERVNLRRRLHLTAAAEQWEASNRDVGALWAGVLLAEAARYDDLNSLETAFVQTSRAAIEAAVREEAARHKELEQAQQLAEEQRRRTEAESMRAEMERQRAEERSRDAGRLRRWVQVATAGIVLALLATAIAVTGLLTAQNARDDAQQQGKLALQARDQAQQQAIVAQAARDDAESQKVAAQQARDQADAERTNAATSGKALGQLRAAAMAISTNFSDLGLLVATHVYRTNPSTETRGALLDALQRMPKLTTFLRGHTLPVNGVAYSSDGSTVASASDDMSIILWDIGTGKPRGQPLFGHTDAVTSAAFSADGKLLASGSRDHTVILWDVAKGQQIGAPLSGHTSTVWSVEFSPDGRLLASSGADGTVRLWGVSSNRQVGPEMKGDGDSVDRVVFSPDGKLLASANRDSTVRLWSVGTQQPVGEPLQHDDVVYAVAFSPDGKTLASGGLENYVSFWDVASGQKIGEAQPPATLGAVWSVAFNSDGTVLATAGSDTGVLLWDVAQRRPITTLLGHQAGVRSVAFAPSGTYLVSGSDDGTVGVWEPRIGQRLGLALGSPKSAVLSVALSPDGKTLASGARDGSVELWDSLTGHAIAGASIAGHTSRVNSVAFSPDGKTLASASNDQTISLWDASTGQRVGSALHAHIKSVTSVAFSPDGTLLASGSLDDTINLWDPTSGTVVATLGKTPSTAGILSLAFSPDGALLAAGSDDHTISLWDVPNRKRIEPLLVGHSGAVNSVTFSPDGKTLASGSGDYSIRLWDTETHQRKVTFSYGHSRTVNSVAFSHDGKTLASASTDTTIILWDPATGQRIGPQLTGHQNTVNSVVFDQNEVLYSGADGKLIARWDLSGDAIQAAACRMVNRNLTPTEWGQQFGGQPYARTCTNLSVNRWAISEVIQDAEARQAEGDNFGAQAAYAVATGWVTKTSDWSLDNSLCWWGSLDNLAETVMPACNRAVEVAPDRMKSELRDSRGVARALVNDIAGAIDDFQAYVDASQGGSAISTTMGNERSHWLSLLKDGTNPFKDHSVLAHLRDE